jgi:hypothetical protein
MDLVHHELSHRSIGPQPLVHHEPGPCTTAQSRSKPTMWHHLGATRVRAGLGPTRPNPALT